MPRPSGSSDHETAVDPAALSSTSAIQAEPDVRRTFDQWHERADHGGRNAVAAAGASSTITTSPPKAHLPGKGASCPSHGGGGSEDGSLATAPPRSRPCDEVGGSRSAGPSAVRAVEQNAQRSGEALMRSSWQPRSLCGPTTGPPITRSRRLSVFTGVGVQAPT